MATNSAAAAITPNRSGMPSACRPSGEAEGNAERRQRLHQQQDMRIGDEGREPPMRPPESRDGAAEHQPPVDPDGFKHRAPDRRGEVALDQVLEPQEIVTGAGLPVVGPGFDRPRRGFAVGRSLRTADGGGVELVQPAELPQFGPEHAVVLRQPARIVSLHIDDMAVLNAHLLLIPRAAGRTISGHPARQVLIRLSQGSLAGEFA